MEYPDLPCYIFNEIYRRPHEGGEGGEAAGEGWGLEGVLEGLARRFISQLPLSPRGISPELAQLHPDRTGKRQANDSERRRRRRAASDSRRTGTAPSAVRSWRAKLRRRSCVIPVWRPGPETATEQPPSRPLSTARLNPLVRRSFAYWASNTNLTLLPRARLFPP